jgi:hypothetical protein
VLTTYGTLRSDAVQFKDIRFDYCILDEAQAIKNSSTLAAKAVRLLKADHRLAMSGTPVKPPRRALEPFSFSWDARNASVFGVQAEPDEPSACWRGLATFILPRPKRVAPSYRKTSQTILRSRATDRKLYDELRDYYARLLKKTDGEEEPMKFQVLEALCAARLPAPVDR